MRSIFFSIFMVFFALNAGAEEAIQFESAVFPIVKAHCIECHNGETHKGELNLNSNTGISKGGESGPVFIPGAPEKSLLYTMVHHGEMPKKGGKLSHDKIKAIRRWIEAGAQFAQAPVLTEKTLSQHDVLPIVLLRCAACHGGQLQESGLDLRTVAGMLKGGTSGPALIPGDPDSSRMIQRIESNTCPPQDKLLKFFVKRPPGSEIKTLREWISVGAPVGNVTPDIATTQPDPLVTEEDRQHWAFQPPRKPEAGSSVDFFIQRKLKTKSLDFAPEADRDTLIRRAYLGLIGMPPSRDDWEKWSESKSENWFSEMVDQLLSSPHYGERWGRYWLDLAGYADSEGGLSADPVRKVAWKYRDYVIQAFNNDKPYDRFLLEQLAGDELIDYQNASEVTEEMVENLVATGFLRMGIDQTGSRTMNFAENRIGVIADAIDVLGSGVMGLTLECVRCHSHKYDPIPQRDYYRLKAVFQGALDEHDWLSFKTRSLNIATLEHHNRVKETNPLLEKEIRNLEAQRKQQVTQWHREMLRSHHPELTEKDHKATFVALRRADNTRSQEQRLLVEKLQKALVIPLDDQPLEVQKEKAILDSIDRQIEVARSKLEPPIAIRALWDRGEPSPTYILRRGEHTSPGRLVGPGIPSVLTDGKTPFAIESPFPNKTGRRLALARWLIQSDHPLTARVLVNRIWYHHFGTGLVKTVENFGVQGENPSHPDLLDWLAVEFVENGWSIKELHRRILNSRTWRQSGSVTRAKLERDSQNRLLSRFPLLRMDAEALRDSLLFVSGKLDPTPGGYPDGVSVDGDGLVAAKPTTNGGWRRSVYIQYRRTEIPTMMNTFDYPEMGPNCVSRSVSTVSPQSLLLLNNDRIRELAGALAKRVANEAVRPDERVDLIYQIVLSRNPSAQERNLGVESLLELQKAWGNQASLALESYCHAIMNSAGFIYID